MKAILVLIVFLSANLLLLAQVETYNQSARIKTEAYFYQDVLNFKSGKENITRVDVYVMVPYRNLLFIKSPDGFTAKYTVSVSVFNEDKDKLLVEKTWNEKVNVIDFKVTGSKGSFNVGSRSFELQPGKYYFRTSVEDKDSKREASVENLVAIKEFNEKLSLSDILLVTNSDSTKKTNEVIPNISRNIPLTKEGINFYYEVYNTDSAEVRETFEYSVLSTDKKVLHKEVEDRTLVPGTNQVLYNIKNVNLDLGSYILSVSIIDEDFNEITSVQKTFYSRWQGLPSAITDIDKAISQLVYIATPDELEYIEDANTQQEKTKRFLEFWKKKDPSPNNDDNEVFDEYYRRVAYANESFSNYTEGWRSDRGMVLIILGAPNNIDRHPFEYDPKPYEVWEYYDLNRRFVFLDETGFGDYRLITPLTGDLYRYRY